VRVIAEIPGFAVATNRTGAAGGEALVRLTATPVINTPNAANTPSALLR
jgi:hypothetical protein